MLSIHHRKTTWLRVAAFTSAILIVGSAPVFAMTGSEAIRACEQKPGCKWNEAPGGTIDITVGGHLILCPSLTSQCDVLYKGTKRKVRLGSRIFRLETGGKGNNNTDGSRGGNSTVGGNSGGSTANGGSTADVGGDATVIGGGGCKGGIC